MQGACVYSTFMGPLSLLDSWSVEGWGFRVTAGAAGMDVTEELRPVAPFSCSWCKLVSLVGLERQPCGSSACLTYLMPWI